MSHGSVDRQVEKRYGHVKMIEAAFDRFTIQFMKGLGVNTTIF